MKKIFFLHIPKTAGSTFRFLIEKNYCENERLHYNWPWWEWKNPEEDFHRKMLEEHTIRFVYGHFSYGLHRVDNDEYSYITFLRNPVNRVISGFFHVLRENPKHRISTKVREMDFGTYMESGIVMDADNGQVRRISGIGDSVPYGQINQSHLDLAIANLERDFSLVGVTEKFDASILALAPQLGWAYPVYWTQNIGKNKKKADVDPSWKKLAGEKNVFDIQLYRYAAERFAKDANVNEADIRRFHQRNRLYNIAIIPYKGYKKLNMMAKKTRRKLGF